MTDGFMGTHNDELLNQEREVLTHLLESNEAILVILMRIYDVQMTQLAATNPDQAVALEKLHEAGRVLSAMPYLNIEEQDEQL